MPSTLESCENFFGTQDLYVIFEIEKEATVAEGKCKFQFVFGRKIMNF